MEAKANTQLDDDFICQPTIVALRDDEREAIDQVILPLRIWCGNVRKSSDAFSSAANWGTEAWEWSSSPLTRYYNVT